MVRRLVFRALLLMLLPMCGLVGADEIENAPARYGPWRSCKIGGGGYLQNVVLSPSNPMRAYAYVDVGGLYRSDDGGRRWRMLHGNWPARQGAYEVRGVSVDPRDDRRVMAAVGGQWSDPLGIFVSGDAGGSWRQTLTASFMGNGAYRWAGVVIARHPANPDIVLAASVEQGIWRSEDNGESWRACGAEGTYPSDLRFDRSNPDRVWLCAQQVRGWFGGQEKEWKTGLYTSDDAGRNWRRVTDTAPSEMLQDPVDAARWYGLFEGVMRVSRDGGLTWQPFADGLPPRTEGGYTSEGEFQSLAAGPDFVLTASTLGTFYRLRCGEAKWERIEREGLERIYEGADWFGPTFGAALASIVVDPRDPGHWYFTDWFAIYQTRDAGKHWRLSIDGIEATVIHVLEQDPTDPRIVHLGMADDGYFRSEDGGERFDSVGSDKGITNNVKCVSVSPARPARVYAVGPRTWEWESNQVFVSDDRGKSLRRSPMTGLPDMTAHHCDTIVADPRNAEVVYLAVSQAVSPGGGGVYRSDDGGDSWQWMGAGLPEGEQLFAHEIWSIGREIAIGPDGALVCISRDRWLVYRYDREAQRWVQARAEIDGAPNCVVADPSAPGRFFLAAGGVYRSDDSGKSWRRVLDSDVLHVAADRARPGRLAAGAVDGVMLSEDGGGTWRMLDQRLPHRRHNLVAFAGDRLLVGSAGSGAFWMPLPKRGT